MIDLITSKALKKSGRKKSKTIVLEQDENDIVKHENEIVKQTVKRRKHENCKTEIPESTTMDENLPGSTTLDENFMLPNGVEFVKSDKALGVDEATILSDLDDPNNSEPLSNLIGCRSKLTAPESGMKCVWSHKKKARKKNSEMCRCFSELENHTLVSLGSAKVLKSKRKFGEAFTSFAEKASEIQCQYPFCKPSETTAVASKHSTMSKLVKKSKRHKVCKKTKTPHLSAGIKRPRSEENQPKCRYSVHFINEVVRLMLENKTVWSIDILTKLVKTKQLRSGLTKDLILKLVETRDLPLLQVLISNTRIFGERHLITVLSNILADPVFSITDSVDGQEKHELEHILTLILSLPFEGGVMKRAIKPITPNQARILLGFLFEKLLNNTPVSSDSLVINQVIQWSDVLVEVYFASLLQETELIRKIYNSINQHIYSCKSLFALNEHLFRIKHSTKFRK